MTALERQNLEAWGASARAVTMGLIWDAVRRALGYDWAEPIYVSRDGEPLVHHASIHVPMIVGDRQSLPQHVDAWIREIKSVYRAGQTTWHQLPIPMGLSIGLRLDAADGFSMRVLREYAIGVNTSTTRLDVAFD